MKRLKQFVGQFVGPVEGAVAGVVDGRELVRVISASVTAGVIGLAVAVLGAVQANAVNIFHGVSLPLALSALTYALEYLRRREQGTPAR